MDFLISHWLDLFLAILFSLALLNSRASPKCKECQKPIPRRTAFCSSCGAPNHGQSRSTVVAPMDRERILRKAHIVAFSYIGGFLPLWLASVFRMASPPTMMAILGGYAVMGAIFSIAVYVRLSRCPTCRSFVLVDGSKNFSASYCATCGSNVDVQPALQADAATRRGLS